MSPAMRSKRNPKETVLFTLWASLSATAQQVGSSDVENPVLEEYHISSVIKDFQQLTTISPLTPWICSMFGFCSIKV
jgi:hypothetical protein